MSKNDFFMQQIEGITDTLGAVFFDKKPSDNNEMLFESPTSSAGQTLLIQLRILIAQGQINEAEDLLFDYMADDKDTRYIEVSQQFYAWLDALSDDQLQICHYSREEIDDGRKSVVQFYKENK